MDILFKIGVFMIPFENFFFAPSNGWAAIAPIIFFTYIIFNIKEALNTLYKYRVIVGALLFGLFFTLINYICIDTEMSNIVGATISIGLGIINLIAFDIYFRQKKQDVKSIVKLLIISYTMSLLMGWIQFIVIKYNISILKDIFMMLEKRSYIKFNRIQFTFTEPSFIGMHVFGVLLPIYIYTKNRNILKLIIAFLGSAVFFSAGVRILIDILVVSILCYMIYFIKNIKNVKVIIATVLVIVIIIVGGITVYNKNYRVRTIINKGIYADGSLASRFFRINASVKGYQKSIPNFIFGYGIGNSIKPIRDGYDEAMAEYKSTFVKEMEELGNTDFTDDSVSYCLYIRIISEFGVVILLFLIVKLFLYSRKVKDIYLKNYIFILLYIYVQFESYGFYAIWLYIILLSLQIEKESYSKIEKE